jgi:transcriptional regulator with XRE-family HTH domain
MNNTKEIFGNNIKKYRLNINLSQEELAAKASLHRTYIGSVERGERNISLENIVQLAKALDVSPSDLLQGIE